MSTLPRLFATLSIALFALAGCETVESALRSGIPQSVTIDSSPTGAEVYIDGAYYGTTPLTVELPRKATHEVALEKNGYTVMRKFFTPTRNARSEDFIRFGIAEDLGLYFDLTPTDMMANLRHALIPLVASTEPFEEMAYRVMLADALLNSGAISSAEHSTIYTELVTFYTTN